jgi:hypothetical protein
MCTYVTMWLKNHISGLFVEGGPVTCISKYQ